MNMKLIIFGATGGNGKYLVPQALEAGHDVTAVARRSEAITIQHKRLKVVQGDVFKPATIEPAMKDQDAVISTLGASDRGPTTVYSEGIANIIQAMRATGVRRLLCISATGLEPGPLWQRLIAKPLLWAAFKNSYTDLVRMETVVKASEVDWTIVRPPRLTDGPRTGQYHDAINKHLNDAMIISRADLASYMLSQLDNRETYCATVEVAH
jgi:putative NADH-flavin reductase